LPWIPQHPPHCSHLSSCVDENGEDEWEWEESALDRPAGAAEAAAAQAAAAEAGAQAAEAHAEAQAQAQAPSALLRLVPISTDATDARCQINLEEDGGTLLLGRQSEAPPGQELESGIRSMYVHRKHVRIEGSFSPLFSRRWGLSQPS